eukprot:7594243-Heterocapsa_arctica.AAC.1
MAVEPDQVRLTWQQQDRLRSTTLYRYVLQQRAAFDDMLHFSAPTALLTASLQFKWDETEQLASVH